MQKAYSTYLYALSFHKRMRHILGFLLLVVITGCHRVTFKEKWLKEKAPAHFTAGFETSKGYLEAEFTREWSPLAVDRLYAQIKHGFYDQTLFYRVRPNYVAQFGADDSVKIRNWTKEKIPDEPVLKANDRGTISFARSGKDSRSSNLFINLKNNSSRLDTLVSSGIKGYPGLGIVTQGMDVIDSLYSGYSDEVFSKYTVLLRDKQLFLQSFPKLDSIQRVFIVHKK